MSYIDRIRPASAEHVSPRSDFPLTRTILLPYALLTALYLIIGGGSAWLLFEAAHAESNVLVHAIVLFALAGVVGISVALVVAIRAAAWVRRIEAHYQEMDHRSGTAELIAAIVHDLRNPLMVLRTQVRTLTLCPERLPEIAASIDHEIVSINDKLAACLDLTRLRHEDDFEFRELADVFAAATQLVEPLYAQRNLEIQVEIDPKMPPLELMPNAIRDALVNLLTNAAESGQTQGRIRLVGRPAGKAVEILVEDRGEGIAADAVPRLFDAFYSTKRHGHGLGLAIVKRIVRAHHGQIRAANRDSGGARFIMTLPIRHQDAPAWWRPIDNIRT